MSETVTLEEAIFPKVMLELHAPIHNAAGELFAAVGDIITAQGRERGRFEGIILTNTRGQHIECTFRDLGDVSVVG